MDKKVTTDPFEIFDIWISFLQSNQEDRYKHSERQGFLNELMSCFVAAKVPYEEAKSFGRKVMEALTTREGRKGNGQYAGWKETVQEQFSATIADYYLTVDKEGMTEANDNRTSSSLGEYKVSTVDKLPDDKLITTWAKDKFGQSWNNKINNKAHIIGSTLYMMFLEDIMTVKDDEPEWFKNGNLEE